MSSTKEELEIRKVFEAIQKGGLETFEPDDVKEVLDENPSRITYQLDQIAEEYDLIEKINRTSVYTKRDYQHNIDYDKSQISDLYERKALDELTQSIKHNESITERKARKLVTEFFTDFQNNATYKKSGKVLSEARNIEFIEKNIQKGTFEHKKA
jgi:hypothetical protein